MLVSRASRGCRAWAGAAGAPGDTTTVILLYLALNWLIWLIVERLTLPDLFPEDQIHDLITDIVRRALP